MTARCFFVIGAEGWPYTVRICQWADQWEDEWACTCEDSIHRGPDLRCKHITYILLKLEVSARDVANVFFEPTQEELNEMLFRALDATDS